VIWVRVLAMARHFAMDESHALVLQRTERLPNGLNSDTGLFFRLPNSRLCWSLPSLNSAAWVDPLVVPVVMSILGKPKQPSITILDDSYGSFVLLLEFRFKD